MVANNLGVKLGDVNSPASPRSLLGSFSFGSSLLKTIGVGALAGLLSFGCSEWVQNSIDPAGGGGITRALAVTSLWVAINGLIQGVVLLSWDNASSLRGKWHRDLAPGAPLFAFLGLASGALAQIIYSIGMAFVLVNARPSANGELGGSTLLAASLIRGLGWAFFGAGIGLSIGVLRGDKGQMLRGGLGGAIGGFIGGLGFNFITLMLGGNNPGTSDVLPRAIGVILLGAFLGGALRLVGEVLKSAWLLGISTGPNEGKEYPLGKARVSVGRAGNCDLSLFRDEALSPQVGALVFQNGVWWWQGEAIPINGIPQSNARLEPGARLQIGQTLFRFNDRSKSAPHAPISSPVPVGVAPASVQAAPAPVALSWTFSPAIGNALTGWRFDAGRASATIGRAEESDWQLKDDGTSSRHARLDRTQGGGISITDLGSTNGTYVNGQKLARDVPLVLSGKETIRIGRTQWTLARAS